MFVTAKNMSMSSISIKKIILLLSCIVIFSLMSSCKSVSTEYFPVSNKFVKVGMEYQQLSPPINAVLYEDDGRILLYTNVLYYSGWHPEVKEKKPLLIEINTVNIKLSLNACCCSLEENAKSFIPSDFDGHIDKQFCKDIMDKKGYQPVNEKTYYVSISVNDKKYKFIKDAGSLLRSRRAAWAYPLLIFTPVTVVVDCPYAVMKGGFMAGVWVYLICKMSQIDG